MSTEIDKLLARARALQDQIEVELAQSRDALGHRIEHGRVVISDEVRRGHKAARQRLGAFLAATRPLVFLTAPVIYGLIVPFVLVDLAVSVYQAICFAVYGIPRVRRRDFIVVDRQHLAYLNAIQKLNCVYCGYVNGLIAYVREVAARTEAYWCPIKHAARARGTHERYAQFMDFGDIARFDERWDEIRDELRKLSESRS